MSGDDITAGSALARALNDYPVPGLSAGFADRVVAAAQTRAAALPAWRRPRGAGGWRLGRRFAISAACIGALATAAAATGLLERFDIPVPSAKVVWASITGKTSAVAAAPLVEPSGVVASDAALPAAAEIAGPIDTPEELAEVFRRIDAVRDRRSAARRERIDQRTANAIERRRASGLPLPTPEQEAAFRERIDAAQARREQLIKERTQSRREEWQRKVESGEALTREDIVRPLREDQRAAGAPDRLELLRRMTPEDRREAFRQLPPEQRRALIAEIRARRSGAATRPDAVPAEPVPAVQADTETPAEPQP